ncbi:MAG: nucleotidyltransferase domain-containing protein [Candidatus Bathyarchaeota archaeon]|nr:MAG: nucleotidyltransferase domain-containing protein [Candidatus Bathyarchaeota archaeon]
MRSNDLLESFREDVSRALQNNLVCLLHHGSRAKGEARPDSDYDLVIITNQMDKELIKTLQIVFTKYPRFSFYLLTLDELKTMPKGHYLEFLYAKPLHGTLKMELPTKKEVISYVNYMRRETLSILRHTLILPHSKERKVRLVYYFLKQVYICLSYLAFSESGTLPSTRKQTIANFRKQKKERLGIRLLGILEDWESYKEDVASNPQPYLFMLEEFFRKLHIKQL